MKITNWVLICTLIFISIFAQIDSQTRALDSIVNKQVQYNLNIDSALLDAINGIAEADDGTVYLNADSCANDFFNSLYSAFGIADDEAAQEVFRVYVPVFTIADIDGFSIKYNDYSDHKVQSVWSVKFPYSKEFRYSGLLGEERVCTINYCLDDHIKIVLDDGTIFSGKKEEIEDLYKDSDKLPTLKSIIQAAHLDKDHTGYYEADKSAAIADSLVTRMNYFANLNNEIAEAFGITYDFRLPVDASSEINRAVTGVSALALFQGYPYGVGTSDTFSKFAVAGARLRKADRYYVRQGSVCAYYHSSSCTLDGPAMSGDQYRTKKEAAESGAFACPYCKP